MLYTFHEVANMLRISDGTLTRLIANGQMRAAKVGHQWRISGIDLDAYLDRQVRQMRERVSQQLADQRDQQFPKDGYCPPA